MIKPIILKSELSFLIVGHILNQDGIIIQSKDISMNLIGNANLIYRSGLTRNMQDPDSLISFVWSSSRMMNQRKSKLLFIWKRKPSLGRLDSRYLSEITNLFDKFIEDTASSFFYNLTRINNISDREFEIHSSKILWNISPLLLRCTKDSSYNIRYFK